MTILAIDDEPVMLVHLETELRKVFPKADIVTFDECDEVLAFLETPQSRSLHYAFMDIKLRGMLGIELAKRIKDQCPQTRILFCTSYSYYALEVSQIEALLGTFPEDGTATPGKLVVHTFGNFEVLYNGTPLVFEREKAKELLALLIDRQGLSMTNGEIEAFLWEELHSPQYLQTLFYSLRKTLRGIGFEDLLIRTRNHTSIDVSKLHCDLYEFLKGSADAVNSYAGEYMNNYSWAELTNARLYNGTFSDFVLAAQARSRR